MTRDEAIRGGTCTLAEWHRSDHGQRCVCLEAEQFGAQSAAVVDTPAACGVSFESYAGTGSWALGPPSEARDSCGFINRCAGYIR